MFGVKVEIHSGFLHRTESYCECCSCCTDGSEYDVLQPQDPVQTFHFLPDRSTKPKSKFSAVDPMSQYATSFTFSAGSMDFSPLMVYGLMANGDMYSMGPVLPLHAEVPIEYIASLQAWVSEKAKILKTRSEASSTPGQQGSAEHAALVGRVALQEAWVKNVAKQAAGQDDKPTTPAKRRGFGLRDPSPTRGNAAPPPPGYARIHPPHLTATGGPATGMHRPLMRQGPLLIDPAPQEVGNGVDIDEQVATDITVIRAAEDGTADDGDLVNVVAVAWSGGRVDLSIEEDAPEPRWMSSRDPAHADVVLPLVESILVTFPDQEDDSVPASAPHFIPDPIHSDVVYLAHASGVDAVSIAPWVDNLLNGEDKLPPSDVACLVESS